MDWHNILVDNWHVKLVAAVMVWAAWIDGKELRVPNWLTFPMVLTGYAGAKTPYVVAGKAAHGKLINAMQS